MNEKKKRTYESTTLGLPPLKMVLGDVPDPEPVVKGGLFSHFRVEKPDVKHAHSVQKLIGYMKETK